MLRLRGRIGASCLFAALVVACSASPDELVAKHTKRGDEYFQAGKFKEAAIEYKNAVKAGPKDARQARPAGITGCLPPHSDAQGSIR